MQRVTFGWSLTQQTTTVQIPNEFYFKPYMATRAIQSVIQTNDFNVQKLQRYDFRVHVTTRL